MSRRAARFTQADLHRALRAVAQAGVRAAVEIGQDGTMRIVPLPQDSEKAPAIVAPQREIIL